MTRPKRIGAYLIAGAPVGTGGMGTVYIGRHFNSEKARAQGGPVAIKVLHPRFGRDPDFRGLFIREASLGLKLEHPGIVRVLDLVVDGDTHALIMEFARGRTLASLIGERPSGRPFRWSELRPLVIQLCDALAYAHGNGVIHRDLKPDNIVVDAAPARARVLDFGIARDSARQGPDRVLGTPEYMAPEQRDSPGSVDERADIYALGMSIYEALTGRWPWGDGELGDEAIHQAKLEGRFPGPIGWNPTVPPRVSQAVLRSLHPSPAARFPNLASFLGAIGEVLPASGVRTALELELEPRGAAEGLVFRPDPAPAETSLSLVNRLDVPLELELRCDPVYEVSVSDQEARDHLRVVVPGGRGRTLELTVRRSSPKPPPERRLVILGSGWRREVPLLFSAPPTWLLKVGDVTYPVGAELELVPRPGVPPRWRLRVGPSGGSGQIMAAALEGADGALLLDNTDTLPRVLRSMAQCDLVLEPAGALASPLRVSLVVTTAGGERHTWWVVVRPGRPVDLKALEGRHSGAGPLFLGGQKPHQLDFVLMNNGTASASLRAITPEDPWCSVSTITLVHAQHPDDVTRRTVIEPHPGDVRLVVQRAGIPFGAGVLTAESLDSEYLVGPIRLEISPQIKKPNRSGGLLVTLRVRAVADGVESKHIVKVWTEADEIVDPVGEAILLLDYGTVNTCAAVYVEGEPQDDPLVPLERAGDVDEGGDRAQFKSVYRVRRWGIGGEETDFDFGLPVWREIAVELESTDLAPKLRLGLWRRRRAVTRTIRDGKKAGRRMEPVSGTAAATIILREVLRRVTAETGYRFPIVRLTAPSAFDERSLQDLYQALAPLRQEFGIKKVQFPCSEPEAYLSWMLSQFNVVGRLNELHDSSSASPEHGVLGAVIDIGGGTTDVTLFEFLKRGQDPSVRMVASHGDRTVGGERITDMIAHALFKTIPGNSRFDFPLAGPEEDFGVFDRGDVFLDQRRKALHENFGVLRDLAERAKCDPSEYWGTRRVSLTPRDGGPKVEVVVTLQERMEGNGLLDVIEALVAGVVDDLLSRIQVLNFYGTVDRSAYYPSYIAVAGNSSRLWCLEELIKTRIGGAFVLQGDLEYRRFPAKEKTGVLLGLAGWMSGMLAVEILDEDLEPDWWYVEGRGGLYLALVPGTNRATRVEPADLPPIGRKRFLVRHRIRLASGPAPPPISDYAPNEQVLDVPTAFGLGIDRHGHIEPGPEVIGFCELRMGFEDGRLGLWFGVGADDDGRPERWIRREAQGVELRRRRGRVLAADADRERDRGS